MFSTLSHGMKAGTNDEQVNTMLMRAARLFPVAIRQTISDMLEANQMPAPATISRSCLFVDVSFMKLMAVQHANMVKEDAVFFGLTDSTEIKGLKCIFSFV